MWSKINIMHFSWEGMSYHSAKENNCYCAGDHYRIPSQLCMARSRKLQILIFTTCYFPIVKIKRKNAR